MPHATRPFRLASILLPLLGCTLSAEAASPSLVSLRVEPSELTLRGKQDLAQLIVTGTYSDASERDLTALATWEASDPSVVLAAAEGLVTPLADGVAEVSATVDQVRATAKVAINGAANPIPRSFAHDVLPALTKAGCNQGACHGTPTGKNGFRLSLRGYDPSLDFMSLAREAGTRRVNPMHPEESLLLKKGAAQIDHRGGPRFTPENLTYQVLKDWIAEGLRPEPESSAKVVRLEVTPAERIVDTPAKEQQIVARAHFSDGTSRDVTRLAVYTASDVTIARIDGLGRVRKTKPGELTVLVGYEDQVATSKLIFREPDPAFSWPSPPANNFIDTHLLAKQRLLQIIPSGLCDDATFIRRVFLDTIGIPPTPDEVRSFLGDAGADKRNRLIASLLDRPEYVDFWTLKWADRLGCNQRFVGLKGAYSYHRWIKDQVAANVPFDRFVRSIVTAKGSNYSNPPASFYRRLRNPEEAVESVSQLFLGIRLQCAKCHNHVAERWTQDDYYHMAAFFNQVRFKNGPQFYETYNKEETVYLASNARTVQPRTGLTMAPRALDAEPAETAPGGDHREALADWLVSPSNPFFAKAAVNRIWFHLLGRGIVDPVDDFRESNPPASAELLQALADDFIAHGFDVKHTIRVILESRTYQLDSGTNPTNAEDSRYFSHAMIRPLTAEQLLDSLSQATGVAEPLFHLPPGTRATQIPDGEFNHPFLKSFGQPPRSVACECERESDATLEQALQVVGGRTVSTKIATPDNRIGRLLARAATTDEIVDEMFLATLGREPTEAERTLARESFGKAGDTRRAAEDLLWSLINHPEFLFQH